MRSLAERIQLAKTVLKELSRQPLCRTELEKRTVRKYGTHATFDGIFHYLVQNGYVVKSDQKHRAPYALTDRSARFLEAL